MDSPTILSLYSLSLSIRLSWTSGIELSMTLSADLPALDPLKASLYILQYYTTYPCSLMRFRSPSEMSYSSNVKIPPSRKRAFPRSRYFYVMLLFCRNIKAVWKKKKVAQLRLQLALCCTIIVPELEGTLRNNVLTFWHRSFTFKF